VLSPEADGPAAHLEDDPERAGHCRDGEHRPGGGERNGEEPEPECAQDGSHEPCRSCVGCFAVVVLVAEEASDDEPGDGERGRHLGVAVVAHHAQGREGGADSEDHAEASYEEQEAKNVHGITSLVRVYI
jgi:hypothetical protein